MFVYEKRLQYPIRIKQTNPKLAKIIITQYGGAYSKCYDYYILAYIYYNYNLTIT
nr:manganese catalase family protein [Ruminococcus sp. 1001270H_150608_F2]